MATIADMLPVGSTAPFWAFGHRLLGATAVEAALKLHHHLLILTCALLILLLATVK